MRVLKIILLTLLFMLSINTRIFSQSIESNIHVELQSSTSHRKEEVDIKLIDRRLSINNTDGARTVEIYNIMGVRVLAKKLNKGINQIDLSLPKGYYIIKVGRYTKKIILR